MKINHSISSVKKRQLRVRGKLHGSAARPRVSISRSNRHTYMQAIDDTAQVTLVGLGDFSSKTTGTKTQRAESIAKKLAAALQEKGVTAAIIDRGRYKYHGRIKVVAETLRAAGINV